MSARDPLYAEIARLRDDNDALRARVAWLEGILAPVDNPFPPSWRLTKAERCILALLLRRSPAVVRRETLHSASSPAIEPATDVKVVHVLMSHLRGKLRGCCPDATIDTVWREGWRISGRSKAIIEAAIARADAAGDPPPASCPSTPGFAPQSMAPSSGGHA